MPVYPVPAASASCRVEGCGCAHRVPFYPSDTTDAEWELLRPHAEATMAELRHGPGGRPMVHQLRAMVDAIRYVAKYGIEWRALPADFPPWKAVYAFFERWSARGLPMRLADRLRERLRVGAGRAPDPSAAIIDSQSVKAADTVGAASSGYDGGMTAGRRSRAVSGTSRWTPTGGCWPCWSPPPACRTATGGHRLLALLRERFATIALVWADGGYAGRLLTWAAAVLKLTVSVVKRNAELTGFAVLPRRWVVERTFGWLNRHRRLVRDYERRPDHHEAMVWWATVMIMTKQLARQAGDEPAAPRWGGQRYRPLIVDQQLPEAA